VISDDADRAEVVDLDRAGDLARLLLVAADALAEIQCRHADVERVLEACWRHPEAGLLCSACSSAHRQDLVLHPWPDDFDDEFCDVCGPLQVRVLTGDLDADLLASLQDWPPRVRLHRVSFPIAGREVAWPLVSCDRCLGIG
jgi:hypothetical protein